MSNELAKRETVWLAAGLRTPFVRVDGPFADRDVLELSVPVARAMAERAAKGGIDLGVWGSVVLNLAYNNLAREVWLEANLDPHVPTLTTILQCSTSMVGVFQAAPRRSGSRPRRGWSACRATCRGRASSTSRSTRSICGTRAC
ncbi:MAG: hypothetical protein AB1689_07475 [Thermodesulfobacteriota bacterium]